MEKANLKCKKCGKLVWNPIESDSRKLVCDCGAKGEWIGVMQGKPKESHSAESKGDKKPVPIAGYYVRCKCGAKDSRQDKPTDRRFQCMVCNGWLAWRSYSYESEIYARNTMSSDPYEAVPAVPPARFSHFYIKCFCGYQDYDLISELAFSCRTCGRLNQPRGFVPGTLSIDALFSTAVSQPGKTLLEEKIERFAKERSRLEADDRIPEIKEIRECRSRIVAARDLLEAEKEHIRYLRKRQALRSALTGLSGADLRKMCEELGFLIDS